MADDNRPVKYMRYAFGEIVLVVIGILIALQINNWNNEKNSQIESDNFSNRLLKEIRGNIQITESEIQAERVQIGSALGILDMFGKDPLNLQSRTLDSLIFICMTKNEIDLNLGTFSEGLNTGKIALIPSDSLRSLLYGLPALVDNVENNEDINKEDIDNNLMPFLYQHLNWRKMDAAFSEYKEESGSSAFPDHNTLESLKYMLFENLIDNRFYNSKQQLEAYIELKSTLEQLEQLLRTKE